MGFDRQLGHTNDVLWAVATWFGSTGEEVFIRPLTGTCRTCLLRELALIRRFVLQECIEL